MRPAKRGANDMEAIKMKKVLSVVLILLLLPVGGLADVRRGSSGEEVYAIQQLLFDTGFLFEEPDGRFGKNTEAAVKWFQETWNLPVTGVVTEADSMAMYDCWHSLFNPDGTPIGGEPLPDDQLESQPLSPDVEGVMPFAPSGAFPACCTHSLEPGGERIEYCARHAAIAQSAYWAYFSGVQPETPVCRQWEDAINALYDEWMSVSAKEEQSEIAASRAAFALWIDQQRAALNGLGAADAESSLEPVLGSQCAALCAVVQDAKQ